MVDPSLQGTSFPAFDFNIERGKIREYALAIGDTHPAYYNEEPAIPPTFPTVFAFWGGMHMEQVLLQMGIPMRNVLHAEQEYEYLATIHVGDHVRGTMRVNRIYEKAGMDFVELITDYHVLSGDHVLSERTLIIVRASGD